MVIILENKTDAQRLDTFGGGRYGALGVQPRFLSKFRSLPFLQHWIRREHESRLRIPILKGSLPFL